jgi:hypothetical protein
MLVAVEGVQPASNVRPQSFVQRLSPSSLLLLKAALLDGDEAVAAFHAWRPTFDLATIPYSQQRLLPLLQNNLTRLGIRDPILDRFRGVRRYFWVQNLRTMSLVRAVFEELHAAAVPFIVLKGAAIIACYLDDRSLRPMDDIDILVPEKSLVAAVDVLTRMRLFPEKMSPRQVLANEHLRTTYPGWPFVREDLCVDLHWKALHLDRRPEADEHFWLAHRELSLDGTKIRVLDPADQLINICAHAAQPLAGMAITQWPADAALLIKNARGLSFQRLVEEAKHHGLSAILAEGINFLAKDLHLSVPAEVIAKLRIGASWPERQEVKLLAQGPWLESSAQLLLAYQDFRRSTRNGFRRNIVRSLGGFLRHLAQVPRLGPALVIALQAAIGWPASVRSILGRDRYRPVPDRTRLPKVGDMLHLCGSDIDDAPLVAGWSIPEPSGRWTVGREATIAWFTDRCTDDLTLLVDGHAISTCDSRAPQQVIELWANDRLVDSWRFAPELSPPLPMSVMIPRQVLENTDVLMLTFLIRDPHSPAEIGMSDDRRVLGFHLRWMKLIPMSSA